MSGVCRRTRNRPRENCGRHTIRCCGCGARCWRRCGTGRILKGRRDRMENCTPPSKRRRSRGALPHYQKALVVIHIATPRGSDNTKVWDTSNRAIQVILNNLKGVLFPDDDMEHMAFAVAGHWAEGDGYTIVQVSDFSECQQVFHIPYERLRSSFGISAADLQTDTLGTEIE